MLLLASAILLDQERTATTTKQHFAGIQHTLHYRLTIICLALQESGGALVAYNIMDAVESREKNIPTF